MRRVVLDANVVLKWFSAQDEPGKAQALALREAFVRGEIEVVVPYLLALEVLNVAGRRWHWPDADLAALADAASCAVVTADEQMLAAAPSLTAALATC